MEEVNPKKISVIFVLENGVDKCDVSKDMQAAYQCCTDQEVTTAWLSSEECLELNPKKTDIFVLEKFQGNAFTYLKEFKCVIISPRCLTTCLVERKPIPNISTPIFTVAMAGVIATSSGYEKDKKKVLADRIGMMGGIYLSMFNASVTHLITDVVGSRKYKVAAECGVPVMSEKWVNAVWEAGLTENVSASDPQFLKYELPVFSGQLICASQISKSEKSKLMKFIVEYGGRYSPQLECKETKLLIVSEPTGTKYLYAKKWGIPCVTSQWVYDSVSKGYHLPYDDYIVDGEDSEKAKCSTPKFGDTHDEAPDFSMCSTILGDNTKQNINDTITSEFSVMAEPITPKKSSAGSKDYVNVVNKLDVSEAKKAGSFLDGCKVYLSGFNPSQVEKLRKIINGGGATRFHQMTESVSHVIVGEFIYEEMKNLKSGKFRPFVVRVDWLLESMKLGRVADEEKFLCFESRPVEPPSPLSKKGLQLLQGASVCASPAISSKINTTESKAVDEPSNQGVQTNDKDILQQYLGNNVPPDQVPERLSDENQNVANQGDVTQERKSSTINGQEEPPQNMSGAFSDSLFQGIKFVVAGFNRDDEEAEFSVELQQMLVECGGQVMTKRFKGIADYGVVPLQGAQLPCTVGEVITHLWLEDCHEQEKVLPVEYFHKPFSLDSDCKPLTGCVVGISSYVGRERVYLSSLAEALGAYSQEVFSKKDIPEKNAVASTHLICPSPEGNKYAAAVKWGLPAVTKEWLLACAQKRQKVPETNYLVTDGGDKSTPKNSGSVSSSTVKEALTGTKTLPSGSDINISEKPEVRAEDTTTSTAVAGKGSYDNEKTVREISENQLSSHKTPVGSSSIVSRKSSQLESIRKMDASIEEKQSESRVEELRKEDSFGGYNFTPPAIIDVHNRSMNESLDRGKNFPRNQGSTPSTPYGRICKAEPSNSTKKAWKNWVENIPRIHQQTPERTEVNPKTPFSELKKRLWASVDKAFDNLDAKAELELVSCRTEKLDATNRKRKRVDEEGDKNQKRLKPLNGIIAYIWKELPKKQRDQLSAKIENMGGVVQNFYNNNITHAVFMGEESENSEEFKLALKSGKTLVAPAWVELCAAEGIHKDESLFPPSDYPMNSATDNWESLRSARPHKAITSTSDVSQQKQATKNDVDEGKESFRKPELQQQLKKLNSLLADDSPSLGLSRLTRTSSRTSWEGRYRSGLESPEDRQCPYTGSSSPGWNQALPNPSSPSTQGSVGDVISWQENRPSEEEMKRKINLEQNRNEEESKQMKPPKFMFSSIDDEERAKYREWIENLGGSVSADPNFNIEATHLITSRLTRSEKLLGSIASGIWILHPKYIEACKSKGRFIEEEPYEWGNPHGLISLPSSGIEKVLSEAVHRWRIRIKGDDSKTKTDPLKRPVGAFEGVCAIIHMAEEKAAAFQRLIVAGGGSISTAKPPYSDATDATMCFMEVGRGPGSVDMESLAKKGIPCLKPLYLNECLTRMNSPDPIEFAIPDYIAALKTLER